MNTYIYEIIEQEPKQSSKNCCSRFGMYIYDKWKTFTSPEYRILKIFKEEIEKNRLNTVL